MFVICTTEHMQLRTLQCVVHGIIDVGLAKAPGEYIGQVVGRRSPLFDPTAVATMLVVTLSKGMFSSFVTVPKMDNATPTAASSLEPAGCMCVSRLSCCLVHRQLMYNLTDIYIMQVSAA